MRRLIVAATLACAGAMLATAQWAGGGESITPAAPVREIVGSRTGHAQVFDTGGNGRMAVISTQPRFARDVRDGMYRDPASLVRDEPSGTFTHAVKTDDYTCRFSRDDAAMGHSVTHNGSSVTYTPTGDWAGKAGVLTPRADGVKEDVHFAGGATPQVSWRVVTDANVLFNGAGLTFHDESGAQMFWVPPATAEDSRGEPVPVTAAYDGAVLTYTLDVPEDALWPIVLDPSTVVSATDALYWHAQEGANYLLSRLAMEASYSGTTNIEFGQMFIGGYHYIIRGTLGFDTSMLPGGAVIDSAKVVAYLMDEYTQGSEFDMVLLEGTFDDTPDTGWYNDFTGWVSGTAAYSVTPLAPPIPTTVVAAGDTIRFVLNELGCAKVNPEGKTRFMLMSSRDIAATPPSGNEYGRFEDEYPYLVVWYHVPQFPADFTMSSPDPATIICTWTDRSNEDLFYIMNMADSSVVSIAPAGAVADTITGLSPNSRCIWAAVADSAGVRLWSVPDTCYTRLDPPAVTGFAMRPISSDTLRVALAEPPNATSGLTGMDVDALSGPGATDSGWRTGTYSYTDGGLNPDSTYIYCARYRNGDGITTDWSPSAYYQMGGRAAQSIVLAGDAHDDYTLGGSAGVRDSTVVRAGKTDTGGALDGFVSFDIPWEIHKGGVDSLFLRLTRTTEHAADTPALTIAAIPVKDLDPVETLDLGAQGSTGVTISWTIDSGTGEKRSPDLRPLFRAWQELDPARDHPMGFGLKLDDAATASGERAVFLDAADPAWPGGTVLEVYYTPGVPDSLDSAPTGFSLAVAGPDTIVASWTDTSRNELGYVLLNLADSTRVAGADTLAENTESVRVGGLTPNTVHAWFVRAFSAADDSASSAASARTGARMPGATAATPVSATALRFVLDPADNPAWTRFAVQDSLTGRYVDASATPDTLRPGPPGEWGWRTWHEWGGASGDTLRALTPDSLAVIRAKATTGGD